MKLFLFSNRASHFLQKYPYFLYLQSLNLNKRKYGIKGVYQRRCS
nr:MAG TPA: hypothetical protein [Caudoviricetes sp.]